MKRAIQSITECGGPNEASMYAEHHLNQDGCLGVRVLPKQEGNKPWRVQAFYRDERTEDDIHDGDGWLPDGMRYVWLPDSVLAQLRT